MAKTKNKKQRQPNVKKQKPEEPGEKEPDTNFDFGGLPNRDLKKNLGCG